MLVTDKKDKKMYNLVSWVAWSNLHDRPITNIESFQNGAWSVYRPNQVPFPDAPEDAYYSAGVQFMKNYKNWK